MKQIASQSINTVFVDPTYCLPSLWPDALHHFCSGFFHLRRDGQKGDFEFVVSLCRAVGKQRSKQPIIAKTTAIFITNG